MEGPETACASFGFGRPGRFICPLRDARAADGYELGCGARGCGALDLVDLCSFVLFDSFEGALSFTFALSIFVVHAALSGVVWRGFRVRASTCMR